MVRKITDAVSIPVIAIGGANGVESLVQAVVEGGASAVAAESLFVFHGPHRAALINFPSQEELKEKLYSAA